MHKYHFVAKAVAPKREALRIAQEDLAETQRLLDAAKARLREVRQGRVGAMIGASCIASLYESKAMVCLMNLNQWRWSW